MPVTEYGPTSAPEAAASDSPPPARYVWLLHVAVAAAVGLCAAKLYDHFWREAPALWYSVAHDRNGHCERSLSFACAFQKGDVGGVIKEIHAATVWPPLHPLVTGAILAVGGLDYRLAVLSSLFAWVAMCWFAFALAYRLAPANKTLAGLAALLFALASPAHRAFATDIMLESMGAALTLGVLYLYLSARQTQSAWHARGAAILFTALFVTKYNYWTLLTAGLVVGTLWEFRAPIRAAISAWWRSANLTGILAAQLRHPLTYLIAGSLVLYGYVKFVGPLTLALGGRGVTMTSLDAPTQIVYTLLFLRVFPWWWRGGRFEVARLPVPARQFVQWSAYPLAVWFLWPRRLSFFIWFVTYNQHGRAAERDPWLGNGAYYWKCLEQDYHAGSLGLALALGLCALGLLAAADRRRAAGIAALVSVFVVAALLTNYHSANRSRFLHSWLPVGWVIAGLGTAALLGWVASAGSLFRAAPRLRPALALALLGGVAAVQGGALVHPGHAEEGGMQPQPSLLALADSVSPALDRAARPAVLADGPFESLFNWRQSERHGARWKALAPPRRCLAPAAQAELDAWFESRSCDVVLLIDSPGQGLPFAPRPDIAGVRTHLAASGKFVLTDEYRYAPDAATTVQVWTRASSQRATASAR
jgi:hypothetical protein